MSRLYKRGKWWWYQFKGKRYSTKCTDRKAAEAAARDIERRIADPSYRPAHQTTIGVALTDYLAHQEREGVAPETLKMLDVHVAHISRVLGEHTPIASIGAREIDRFLSTRHEEGASRSTQGKERSTLRGALKRARLHKLYPHAIDEVFAPFKVEYVPLERRLSEPELAKLLAELEPKRAAVCAFIVATGADWVSVLLAQPSDIDLRSWSVKIHGTKNKYRRLREQRVVLPLFRRLLKLSATHVPFERWDNAVRDLKAACRRAQIPRVTPRDLRRTHGYILRARGVEPHLIGVSLGHRDSVMAERVYGKLPPDAFEALMMVRVGSKRRSVQNQTTQKPAARKASKKGAAS